jgi:hypothetical protein
MTLHRFGVGEAVLCTNQHSSDRTWKVPFTVLTCLATDDLTPQYRIRSRSGTLERQATEYELTRMPQPQRGFLWLNEAFFPGSMASEPSNGNLVPWHHLPRAAWHKNEGRKVSGDRHG